MTQKEIIELAGKLAKDIVETSFIYDDPNGPYRCWVCNTPVGQGHTDDCIVTKGWRLHNELNI